MTDIDYDFDYHVRRYKGKKQRDNLARDIKIVRKYRRAGGQDFSSIRKEYFDRKDKGGYRLIRSKHSII